LGTLIQGVGQGSGNGLQIWAEVSSQISDFCNKGHGAKLILSILQNHFMGFGSVDDVDLVATHETKAQS